MSEDTATLTELMLHADQFCSKIEAAMKDVAPSPEQEELRTKLGQCRAQLVYLQNVLDDSDPGTSDGRKGFVCRSDDVALGSVLLRRGSGLYVRAFERQIRWR